MEYLLTYAPYLVVKQTKDERKPLKRPSIFQHLAVETVYS